MTGTIIILGLIIVLTIAAYQLVKKLQNGTNITTYDSDYLDVVEDKYVKLEKEIKEMPIKTVIKRLNKWFCISIILGIGLTSCIKTEYIIVPSFPTKPSIQFELDEKTERAYLKIGDDKKLLEYLEKWDIYRTELINMFTNLSKKGG